MSIVRRVFDAEIGREVAIKSLLDAGDPSTAVALVDEARTVGGLEHPNVVPVYDLLRDDPDGRPRLVMRAIDARTLAAALAEETEAPILGLRLEHLLHVFLKVCDAVAFAHSRGVLHCDINPRNVMVGTHGQVYLVDWGLALTSANRPSEDSPAGGHAIRGTPAYMAPEQVTAGAAKLDERTDVYGLGAILYEFLTLRPPHAAPTAWEALQLAARAVRPPEDVLPDRMIPAALSGIAMRALALEPSARYPTVEALRGDVETFLRTGGWFAARRFPAGASILREGDPSDVAYIVTAGRCTVSRPSPGGGRTLLRTVGPGEIFGEVGLVSGTPRLADVHAETDVSTLVVTRDALERELARSTWVRAFIQAAVARFAELDVAQRRD